MQAEGEAAAIPEPEQKIEQDVFVTVSDALEYLFCPRFIFFERCLMIPEHQEKRFKVLKGRELHEIREKVNRDYLRKRLRCTRKEISVYLTSHKYHFKGEVDEVLFLEDGTAAPLDYKYAEFKNTIYKTHKYQAALYGILIMEHFGVDVKKGFVCYTRSNNYVVEIDFRQKDFEMAKQIVREILMIIQRGYYPEGTKQKARCVDCTYRNICATI
ncbi:CRISPR-associated protein Cas4 [Methanothrix soehngenii]|uniref:CRISPR-associated protein Cas4 n=1 Tax=Methanothrix soehngenii TaxID=2223 RepID=UPI002FE3B5E8